MRMSVNALDLLTWQDPNEDKFLLVKNVSWANYEAFMDLRGESSRPRITYWKGTVEVMTLGRDHELRKSCLARLLEAYALERDIDLDGAGSSTMMQPQVAGLEPDECYFIGPWSDDDLPHLAIEVEWTRGGLRKLPIYRTFGVGEVWIWKRGLIGIHVLTDGEYVPATRSRVLPDLDVAELAEFVVPTGHSAAVRRYLTHLKSKA